MRREVLVPHLRRIDGLVFEIDAHVPQGSSKTVDFRADLAGLFVVAVAAMYEACVKETIVTHASGSDVRFERFATRSFDRLNSRIRVADLYSYARRFDDEICASFKFNLNYRKQKFSNISGKSLLNSYDQVLDWRHDFAHAGKRNTTIEEAVRVHKIARHVIYAFHDAFVT